MTKKFIKILSIFFFALSIMFAVLILYHLTKGVVFLYAQQGANTALIDKLMFWSENADLKVTGVTSVCYGIKYVAVSLEFFLASKFLRHVSLNGVFNEKSRKELLFLGIKTIILPVSVGIINALIFTLTQITNTVPLSLNIWLSVAMITLSLIVKDHV